MLKKIKAQIEEKAYTAVCLAEDFYSSGEGKLKKEYAISWLIEKIKLPAILIPIKPIIVSLLNRFLDSAVERAVLVLKQRYEKPVHVK